MDKLIAGLPYVMTIDTRLPPPQTVSIVAFYENGQFVSVSAGTIKVARIVLEADIAAGKVTG